MKHAMNLTKICLNIESPKKLNELKQFLELNNQPINIWEFKFQKYHKEYNFLQYFNGGWCLYLKGKRTTITTDEFKKLLHQSCEKSIPAKF
jgi:hypothetical protein